jgi:hypothetical protein
VVTRAGGAGGVTMRPYSVSLSPSMIMPLPNTSSAWAIAPPSPGTTIFLVKPNAVQSHSMAAVASR